MDEQRKPEKALVPSLRFEGFNDPWEQRKLGEFAALYKESIPTPSEGHYRLGVRSHGRGTFLEWVAPGKQIGETVMQKVKADNLVVNIVFAWEHAVAITSPSDEKALVSHRFPQYKFDHSVYPPFIGLLILDEVFRHHLWLSSPSGAGRNKTLRQDEMLEYKFLLPGLEEQRAVSSFFSKLDSLIALHQRKHGKLKTVKQSLLEKMFPKEGEDVPEIRFEGFTEPWEQRKLEEVATFGGGHTPSMADPCNYENGSIPWITSQDVKSQRLDKTTTLITDKGAAELNLYPVGSLVVVVRSGILRHTLPVAELQKPMTVNQDIRVIVPTEALSSHWLLGYLEGNSRNLLLKFGKVGTTVESINFSEMKSMGLMMPSREEQSRIGSLFAKLDSLIALHQRELEILKNLKKAMLEKMFV